MSNSGFASSQAGENAPLLQPQHHQSSKRVLFTAVEVPVEPTPSPDDPTQRLQDVPTPPGLKWGIAIMLFITFLSSICFSIVLPSIWPFIKYLQLKEGKVPSKAWVGWAVAVNSAGSFFFSPLVGAWGDRRTAKESLAVTLIVMMAGNVLYSLSPDVWVLLAARFIVGVSCSNYAVSQSYLSYASTTKNRSMVMALNSGFTVLGFIVGPALTLVLNLMDFDIHGVKINSFTAPGYLSAILSIIGLASLFMLKEVPESYKRLKRKPLVGDAAGSGFYNGQGSVKDISQIVKMKKTGRVPWIPVLICLYSYFAYTASFTVFETLGTPYTEHWNWSNTYNGILFTCLGVVCVIGLVFLQVFLRFFNDRILVIATTVMALVGFGIMVDMSGDEFVNLPRFLSGAGVASIAYATGSSLLVAIYSKVLENLDQGVMMGWMSSASSVSRIIGPIVASYSMEWKGPSVVFLEIIGLTGISLVLLIVGYKSLAPLGEKPKQASINA